MTSLPIATTGNEQFWASSCSYTYLDGRLSDVACTRHPCASTQEYIAEGTCGDTIDIDIRERILIEYDEAGDITRARYAIDQEMHNECRFFSPRRKHLTTCQECYAEDFVCGELAEVATLPAEYSREIVDALRGPNPYVPAAPPNCTRSGSIAEGEVLEVRSSQYGGWYTLQRYDDEGRLNFQAEGSCGPPGAETCDLSTPRLETRYRYVVDENGLLRYRVATEDYRAGSSTLWLSEYSYDCWGVTLPGVDAGVSSFPSDRDASLP